MTETTMQNENRNVFIVRCGEAALKGQNKPYFEKMLVERIKRLLHKYEGVEVKRREGLVFVYADKSIAKDEIIHQIGKVFGVASISPAVTCEPEMEAVYATAVDYMMQLIQERGIKTFKVEAKRADKNCPVTSPEIARRVGAAVLKGCKVLKVDVHDPDVVLFVDMRADKAYLYQQKIKGFGGLPLGTNGKGLVLLSGGEPLVKPDEAAAYALAHIRHGAVIIPDALSRAVRLLPERISASWVYHDKKRVLKKKEKQR